MSFPSTSSAFSNFSTTTSSFTGSPSSTRSHHQVPFGSVPGSQPGVLSWGFGMSSANRGGHGWGARMTPPPTSVTWGSQSPTTAGNNRRRRRSDTPESEQEGQESTMRSVRPIPQTTTTTTTKRARKTTTSEGLANGLAGSLSLGRDSTLQQSNNLEDLGKSLASLDKPALLSIFSSLLQSHPHLTPHITSLLPSPTLSSTLSSLSDLTTSLISQIPKTSSPPYVYSRMRLSLESFVQESKKSLSIYVPPTPLPPTTLPTTTKEELYHPTTIMTFLLHLSSSYLSISQSLPPTTTSSPSSAADNPLQSHLLPHLINSFHIFLTRLSIDTNQKGKILPLSTVKNWFESLDQLLLLNSTTTTLSGKEEENEAVSLGKKALEGVRDRMRREIGWLVGIKENSIGMEGVEEEEEEL
ncbi:hypothetical protein JCM16303_001516 [Sporobolomyces ruberrimus]